MSFDISTFLKEFVSDVKSAFPEFAVTIAANYENGPIDTVAECAFFERTLRPHFMKILQKDSTLFDEPMYILRGVEISKMWKGLSAATQDALWKYIRLSLAYSFFGGDTSHQIQSIIGMAKQFWTAKTGKSEDAIDEVLNDAKTQTSIEELLEAFSKSKIAALVTEMIETIRPEQLGLEELNITDINELMNLVRTPNHPILSRATSVISEYLEKKIRTGALTKEELVAEVEGFKARLTGSFGTLIRQAMVGDDRAGPTHDARTMVSNHPDARRARMQARLQRKVRDKTGGKK